MDFGFVKFDFKDEDGNVIGKMKLNPTDPRLATRCKNIGEFFANLKMPPGEDFENVVEDKFCELLGYDCKNDLFGRVAATAIMADGRIYASHVIEVISKKVGPEIQKRRRANIARHTMKYGS